MVIKASISVIFHKIRWLLLLACFLVSLYLFQIFWNQSNSSSSEDGNKVCFHQRADCFTVEIADTPESRRQGLMFRKELALDHGMLFIFSDCDYRAFWMKNTLIPLDIIFLDDEKTIVDIASNSLPCKKEPCPKIFSRKKAQFVLEIPAGTVHRKGLNIGDLASLPRE